MSTGCGCTEVTPRRARRDTYCLRTRWSIIGWVPKFSSVIDCVCLSRPILVNSDIFPSPSPSDYGRHLLHEWRVFPWSTPDHLYILRKNADGASRPGN